MQTHPSHEKYVRAHAASKLDRSQSAEKEVDEEWLRRTSFSSAWARLLDILFVRGQEAIPPVRCAPPSPVLRPRSHISRLFRLLAPLRACASTGLSRSACALLTSLAQGRKAPPTPRSTPQPRAPPSELASDVAGGSSDLGSDPSAVAD